MGHERYRTVREWNLSSASTKLERIRDGAVYVVNFLEHWREWLHPARADEVEIADVKLNESDLHEEGVGVIQVKFKKPQGPV